MDVRNTFTAGKLNLDSDLRLIGEGQYIDALNIRIANSEGSNVGAIEKSLSNKQLTSLSLGENVYTLGSLRDEFEEKIYWAVLSDNGCFVIEYEVATNITTYVLQDTRNGAANVLGFVPDKRLQMVLIVDSDNNNRLLGFTDNNTQPKLINVERAKTYGVNGFNEEMILLIKKPPLFSPTINLSTTPDKENNISEKFIRFAYRYKYLDGEYSALSPLSKVAFKPKSFQYDYNTGTNASMVNIYNTVEIGFDTGSDLVTDIEIVFKESGSNTIYLIETLNKEENGWDAIENDTQTFDFTNSKIYRALPEKELTRLYDNVPLLAKALAVINNRIVFGNYTENYDLIDALGEKVNVSIVPTKLTSAIVENTPTESLKTNRDLELFITYLDGYGRMTTPLTCATNTIHIPNSDSIYKNQLNVRVKNKPPAFAEFYRFFIKQNKIDYDTLLPSLFYEDGIYRWIKLEKSDIDKIKEGDYLVVKADSSSILSNLVKTKVLEIKEQEQNFLEPEDSTSEIIQKPGTYFKIKPQGFNASIADYYNYSLKTYHNSRYKYQNCLRSGTRFTYPAVFYGDLLDDMTVASTNTLADNVAKRFIVAIDNLQKTATGTVTLTGGASGSVDSITVNGVNIMSASVPFNTDLSTTALNVASNINSNTSSPNYTATAVGAVITITPVTAGTSVNGFAVVATTTTLTTTTTNLSGGTENTFRWSSDNGDTWTYEVPITGSAQVLSDGVTITFGAITGHSTQDEWNFYACGALRSDDKRAYGWYRTVGDYGKTLTDEGLTVADEIIENGAVLDLGYDEYGARFFRWEISMTSNDQYENIMEWYFRNEAQILEEIEDGITLTSGSVTTFDKNSIFFMRCVLGHQEDNAEYAQYNADGAMTMIIESQNEQQPTDWAKLIANTTIFQSANTRLVFETDPKPVNDDISYEIGQTYAITNGYHMGNGGTDVNQASGIDAEITLPFFNCFSWGNAVESYKIRDEFYGNSMKIDTRPSAAIPEYRQNKRIASYTFSNVYEQSTNYNALNEFNLGLVNYNDLDDKNGAIQAMVSWDNDLDVYQEDKVVKVLYDGSMLYNKDGSGNVTKTDEILKNVVPYTGEYGISTNPESLSVYGNYTYWADAKRGVFLRKGQSGIEIISNFGIKDWTRDNMINLSTFIMGGYDPYFNQFVISLNGKTLTFSEMVKGWTSFHSWIPDDMVRINNRFYTIKDGQLYLHNDATNGYNNFYGQQFTSHVTTVFNQEHQIDKIFKNIILESDNAWEATIETNLVNSSIKKLEFNNRESRWFAYTRQNENTSDLRGVSQGVGRILSVNGTSITFADVSKTVSIGNSLYQLNGSTKELIGVITGNSNNIITVSSIITTPVVGYFCFSIKDSRIEGSAIRGYYMQVKLEDDSNVANELFAVSTNVVKSYL